MIYVLFLFVFYFFRECKHPSDIQTVPEAVNSPDSAEDQPTPSTSGVRPVRPDDVDDDIVAPLMKRVKTMREVIGPQVLSSIKDAQKRQKENYDRRHKATTVNKLSFNNH